MKITFVEQNIDGMGGVERIICTLANSFSKDNDVSIINEEKRNTNSFFPYDDKIKIYNILDFSKKHDDLFKNSKYFLIIIKIFQKAKRKFIKLFLCDEIKRVLFGSDVIIFGRTTVSFKYLKLFLNKNSRPKIIVRDASNIFCINETAKKNMKKYFPLLVDSFIVSSDESIKAYNDFFGNDSVNMVKIYNPLGITPRVGYSFESKKIVSLGRFDMQKGFENLILAFGLINKKYPEWKLSIYGKGSYFKKLEKLVIDNNIENIEFKKPEKDVINIFNNSAIYVMSSRFEGYANTLVEALACGIPSITYNWLTGADEIISDGINGLIVPLNNRDEYLKGGINHSDVKNLSQALIRLIEDKELCKKISNNAVKIIETRNREIIISKWKEIIYKK